MKLRNNTYFYHVSQGSTFPPSYVGRIMLMMMPAIIIINKITLASKTTVFQY